MPKQPKWLQKGRRLLVEVEIAYIAKDGSLVAIDMAGQPQRLNYVTDTLERLVEEGRVEVKDA